MKFRALLPAILCAALVAPLTAQAPSGTYGQAPEGRLIYAVARRTVAFSVVGAGHRALVTLPPVKDADAPGRLFILTHTGPERLIVPDAQALKEKAPQTWKVSHSGDRRLLRNAESTYWCYTPGLVLPVRFRIGGEDWALVSAELAPKMFVATRD